MPWAANTTMVSIVTRALEIQFRVKRLELLKRFEVAEKQLKAFGLPADHLLNAKKALQNLTLREKAEAYFPVVSPPPSGAPLRHLVVGVTEKRDF